MTRIRPILAADAVAVAELTTQLGYPAGADQIVGRLAHLRGHAENEVLVATDQADRPIAWIHMARTASLEVGELAEIGGLVVDEGHRSDGIGADLVAAAEAWAREHGAATIMVRSRSTRQRAHRFYERLGYVQVKLSHVFEKPLS